MKYDNSLGSIILVALVFAIPYFYYSKSCEWRWNNSGYEYRWNIPEGCKIKSTQGGWVPEKNILASGASKIETIRMRAPDGNVYLIPADDVAEAIKAGGAIEDDEKSKIDPLGLFETDNEKLAAP